MQAFFADDQLLHDPQQFMRLGRLCKPTDLPARAHALQAALATHGIAVATPPDYGRTPLETVHSADYLDFLEGAYARWMAVKLPGLEPGIEVLPNLSPYGGAEQAQRGPCPSPSVVAQAGYYLRDLSCPIGPHTWHSVLRSAHSAVAAADAVCQSGDAAYALCRPSGHHACRDSASGFCYVNNSACAAHRLLQHYGRVAVLDVDAHHGDGTQHIFYDSADVLTVSMHADPAGYYPFYSGYAHERGSGAGAGCNLNLPLPHGAGSEPFLQALDAGLAALRDFAPRALVLSLGFDTYKDDPVSVLKVEIDAYRQVGERAGALGLPTVIVQEGGYKVDAMGMALDAFLGGFQAGRS